jgi:hypothetical protein
MEPTTAELIFYLIAGVIGLVFFLRILATDGDVEMTWGKRRDLARAEKGWR